MDPIVDIAAADERSIAMRAAGTKIESPSDPTMNDDLMRYSAISVSQT